MTKFTFLRNIILIIISLSLLIVAGITISINDMTEKRIIYNTFKDMLPLAIAVLASFLTYSFQRRLSFLQYMRGLWTQTVDAFQTTIQYTHGTDVSQKNYGAVLNKLSIVIDEIRGAYKSFNERSNNDGIYPFEPIKEIYTLVTEINYGEKFNIEISESKRKLIFTLWKNMRKEFLKEFDRDYPTFGHSHWIDEKKLTVTNGRPPSK